MIQTEKPTPRKNRTIVLPFDQEKYMVSIEDPKKFRKMLNDFIEKHPELFPDGIRNGYG
jgi:predicted transcriptional regulator